MMKATNKKIKAIKKNNQGFTLVELLVAVTILTLVVSPLLSAFVTSARINSMSKTKHEATVVAENVFEGIKNFGIEETKNECQAFDSSTFKIIAGSVGGAKASVTYNSEKSYNEKYVFTLKNVSTSSDLTFDIVAEVTRNEDKTNASSATDTLMSNFNLRKKSYFDVVVTVYKDADDASTQVAQFTGSVLDYA
jgi:prepilin-type N-terminal cleavage/methylation domain-containing protein